MKPIGGYFDLELPKGNQQYHNTLSFKSGRSALLAILKKLKPANVYIPFYTCNALLEPFVIAGVTFQFYALNEKLEPAQLPQLKSNEYFLYINYFDLKRPTVESLSALYGHQLIADCSQAFFVKGNHRSWYFNSCRKFFGVPDGAYVYAPEKQTLMPPAEKNENYTVAHLVHRFNGDSNKGYPYFLENEARCGTEQKQMSLLTEHLLSNIDYAACAEKRKQNFAVLHNELKRKNKYFIAADNAAVPMVYPYLPEHKIAHQTLWDNNIFVPVYWKDVTVRTSTGGFEMEKTISQNLLCLPIDHRYSASDMEHLLNVMKK